MLVLQSFYICLEMFIVNMKCFKQTKAFVAAVPFLKCKQSVRGALHGSQSLVEMPSCKSES